MWKSIAPGLVVLASCSAAPTSRALTSPDGGLPPNTYRLDLRHFQGGRSAQFANESLVFRPDVDAEAKAITSESEGFRKVYNRLPCQDAPDRSESDQLAAHGFHGTETMASKPPVRLESISVEMPDNDSEQVGLPDRRVSAICFAYHTSDGAWHGQLAPVATSHDDVARVSRVTLQVQADDVDVVGLVIYDGFVSTISFVAQPQ